MAAESLVRPLNVREKVMALPVVATALLFLLFVVNWSFSQRNQQLIVRIQTILSPAYELSAELEDLLQEIEGAMEDAAISDDAGRLGSADALRARFFARLAGARKNPAVSVNV